MEKLTRYDSYEALKADTNRTNKNMQLTNERNEALKHFIDLLRKSLSDKRQTSKLASTDERGIDQKDRKGL